MSDDKTISDNLKHLLRINDGLSVSELARRTQIPQPTLHHLLNGTTKRPRKIVLEKLASFFAISIPQLTGLMPLTNTLSESFKNRLNISIVPILEWDSVALWPNIDQTIKRTEIIIDKKMGANSFALIMKNTKLDLLFPEGSILIFDPAKKPRDRDFVLVQQIHNPILFNRLFIDKDEYYIKQEQTAGEVKLIRIKPDNDKILGILTEVRLQF